MKKMLGISLFAILAVAPMMASAAVTDAEPTHAETASNDNVAAAAPQYALQGAGAKDGYVATAGYVKGAYNAAIKAVNKVSADTTTALSGKQATLTAGKGISISSNTIKADLTSSGGLKYSGDTNSATIGVDTGNGIELSSGKVSVKAKSNGGITVDSNGVSLTNGVQVANAPSTYTGTGLTTKGYVDEKVATATSGMLTTAGNGLTKSGSTVSASLTDKGGLQLDGETDGSKTIGVKVDGSTIVKDSTSGALKVKSGVYDASGAASTAKTDIETKLSAGSTGYDINAKSLKVQGTAVLTQHQDISGKANTSLNNLSDTGKANISAQGTYDSTATYTDGTVGAAIKGKADKATTLSGYGITNAYTKTETGTQITNAIGGLDASKSQAAAAENGNLSLSITETDGKITAISGSVTHQDISGKANKEGVVATVNKATASKTGASLTVSGTPTGTVSSTFSSGSLSGAKVSVPSSASVATLTTWGDDTTTGTATVSLSNTDASVTGGTVSGTVTSSFTGTGITSGTATGNITGITVSVPGFYENASDTTAETFN